MITKKLCLAAGTVLLAGGLAWAATQSFPLQSSVTGSEIIKNEVNPTSGYFTTLQISTYGNNLLLGLNNVWTGTNTFGGTTTLNGAVTFPIGTATLTPTTDRTGVLNTTAAAGAHEFDGSVFYDSAVASAREVRDDEQFEVLTAAYTLTSQTAAQQALNATTNGALTVQALTTYKFECAFNLTVLSATSGSFGFAWGLTTATLTSQYWYADAEKGGTSVATPGASYQTYNVAANTTLTAATTGTTGTAHIYGQIAVNAAGSVFPEISQGTASAAVVGVGSFCRLWPVGINTITNVGNWN